jgi:cyclopropane-fatty-acyl-phospholipid synthase
LGRFAGQFADSPVSFRITMPDGSSELFGPGEPTFFVTLKNKAAVRALSSIDEGKIGDAYVAGDIDIEGDMLAPFKLRESMGDFHLLTTLWRFLQPFIFGQIHTNKQAITAHYDIDPAFFLSLLDPEMPMYTQGVYISDDETLASATRRKFDYCFEKLDLKAGDHILEIGPGWGAWFEYASARGVRCTGITISQVSIDDLKGRAAKLGREWELLNVDLLAYETDRKYDAIVIMGVIEHLPNYQRVLDKFTSLLKPGGRVFLDGSANTKK